MAQTPDGALKIAAKKADMSLDDYLARIESGQKRCSRCKEWRYADTDFCKDRSRFDGFGTVCYTCRRVREPKSHKGRISTFKGKTHTQEAKRIMSEVHKGKPNPRKGIPRTTQERVRISQSLRHSEKVSRGPSCHSYKDGKAAERRDQRFTTEYKRWRFDVFSRDNFACQQCGDNRGGNLRAHHIQPFAEYPELRLDVSNGITLCLTCHKAVHAKK